VIRLGRKLDITEESLSKGGASPGSRATQLRFCAIALNMISSSIENRGDPDAVVKRLGFTANRIVRLAGTIHRLMVEQLKHYQERGYAVDAGAVNEHVDSLRAACKRYRLAANLLPKTQNAAA